jgi:hypothetical protein
MKPLAPANTRSVDDLGDVPFARSAGSVVGTSVAAVPKPSRLWLWFVAAFAIQFAAWTAWFVIAAHHQVEDVPLATRAHQ